MEFAVLFRFESFQLGSVLRDLPEFVQSRRRKLLFESIINFLQNSTEFRRYILRARSVAMLGMDQMVPIDRANRPRVAPYRFRNP